MPPAPPQVAAPPPYAPPQAVAPLPAAQAGFDVEPLPAYGGAPTLNGAGLFLTPAKLTLVSVAVVVLLGLAFLLGMLVGRA